MTGVQTCALPIYNEKFAKPAQAMMNELQADGVLKADAPFEHEVQWVFWETRLSRRHRLMDIPC